MDASAKLHPDEYGPEMSPEPRNTSPEARHNVETKRFDVVSGIRSLLGLKSAPTQPTTDEARALVAEGNDLIAQLKTLDPNSNEFALALHHATSVLSLSGLQVDPLTVEAYYDRALDYAEAKPYQSDSVLRDIRRLAQSSRIQLNDKQNERAARVAVRGRDRHAAEQFAGNVSDITVKSQLMPMAQRTPYKPYRTNRVHKLRGKR